MKNFKNLLMAVSVALFSPWAIARADEPPVQWEKTFGGPGEDNSRMVRQTTDGGYILVGATNSYGVGDYDVYLVKTDSNGNEAWHKTFGGSSRDSGFCVQQTSDGGYIVAGYFNWQQDACLIKTDNNGNLAPGWPKTYSCGGSGVDTAYYVQQTSDGGYIFVGVTNSCGAGGFDIYLVKTDSNGNEVWHKTFGGSATDEYANCVQQTADGGYIIVGDTRGASGIHVYLIKTDSNGNVVWDKTLGGSGVDHGMEVQQTIPDGGYIIAAYTYSFGAGDADAYLIKTDADGIKEWEKTVGGGLMDTFSSVQQTSDGGYIAAGLIASSGAGNTDAYLVKLEPAINRPPVANAGHDQVVEQKSYDGTEVTLDGSGSTDPDSTPGTNDDIVYFDWFEGDTPLWSGETINYIFPLGSHTVTLNVIDSAGATDTDEVIIVVEDTIPPTISSISASSEVLWPANHKMVEVFVEVDAEDICDTEPFCWILGVTSNEPIIDPGDDNTEPDWEYTDDPLVVLLRAERAGGGDGRVYTIHVVCEDASGNMASTDVDVTVPHDQG